MRKASGPAPAPDSVVSTLQQSKGGGNSLSGETRSSMESHFNSDFSGVRIHTDSKAVQMSRQLNAQAFTHGNDIYFNQGKFNPESRSGKHLLAHELTHTVQQGASPASATKSIQRQEDNSFNDQIIVERKPGKVTEGKAKLVKDKGALEHIYKACYAGTFPTNYMETIYQMIGKLNKLNTKRKNWKERVPANRSLILPSFLKVEVIFRKDQLVKLSLELAKKLKDLLLAQVIRLAKFGPGAVLNLSVNGGVSALFSIFGLFRLQLHRKSERDVELQLVLSYKPEAALSIGGETGLAGKKKKQTGFSASAFAEIAIYRDLVYATTYEFKIRPGTAGQVYSQVLANTIRLIGENVNPFNSKVKEQTISSEKGIRAFAAVGGDLSIVEKVLSYIAIRLPKFRASAEVAKTKALELKIVRNSNAEGKPTKHFNTYYLSFKTADTKALSAFQKGFRIPRSSFSLGGTKERTITFVAEASLSKKKFRVKKVILQSAKDPSDIKEFRKGKGSSFAVEYDFNAKKGRAANKKGKSGVLNAAMKVLPSAITVQRGFGLGTELGAALRKSARRYIEAKKRTVSRKHSRLKKFRPGKRLHTGKAQTSGGVAFEALAEVIVHVRKREIRALLDSLYTGIKDTYNKNDAGQLAGILWDLITKDKTPKEVQNIKNSFYNTLKRSKIQVNIYMLAEAALQVTGKVAAGGKLGVDFGAGVGAGLILMDVKSKQVRKFVKQHFGNIMENKTTGKTSF